MPDPPAAPKRQLSVVYKDLPAADPTDGASSACEEGAGSLLPSTEPRGDELAAGAVADAQLPKPASKTSSLSSAVAPPNATQKRGSSQYHRLSQHDAIVSATGVLDHDFPDAPAPANGANQKRSLALGQALSSGDDGAMSADGVTTTLLPKSAMRSDDLEVAPTTAANVSQQPVVLRPGKADTVIGPTGRGLLGAAFLTTACCSFLAGILFILVFVSSSESLAAPSIAGGPPPSPPAADSAGNRWGSQ